MTYHSREALSSLVTSNCLEPETSIELVRLTYRDRGESILDVEGKFKDEILEQITPPSHSKHDAPTIQLLFLSSVRDEPGVTTNQLRVTAPTLDKICSIFNMPYHFWDGVLIPSVWSKQSGALFHRHNDRGLESIEGFYHYFNEWDRGPLHVWFQYNVQSGAITYVMVDCPDDVKKIVFANAKDRSGCFLHRPLAIDLHIAEQCASWREGLINTHYKQIFVWHENHGSMDMNPPLRSEVLDKKGVEELHRLSRTWNMIHEDLGDLEERLDVLMEAASKLEAANFEGVQSAIESFRFLRTRNHLRRRWVTSFGERTKLIIGFVFALASQKDGETNLDIANLTSTIAEETRQDNSSMITIATMTMLFLPGTFICTVFSMAFFHYGVDNNGNEIFEVSSRIWYFPATAIPCTLLVMIGYQIWQWNREGRMAKRRERVLPDRERVESLRSRSGSTTIASSVVRMRRASGLSAMGEEGSIEMSAFSDGQTLTPFSTR